MQQTPEKAQLERHQWWCLLGHRYALFFYPTDNVLGDISTMMAQGQEGTDDETPEKAQLERRQWWRLLGHRYAFFFQMFFYPTDNILGDILTTMAQGQEGTEDGTWTAGTLVGLGIFHCFFFFFYFFFIFFLSTNEYLLDFLRVRQWHHYHHPPSIPKASRLRKNHAFSSRNRAFSPTATNQQKKVLSWCTKRTKKKNQCYITNSLWIY